MICKHFAWQLSASFSHVYPAWNCCLAFSAALWKQEHFPFWEFALLSGVGGFFAVTAVSEVVQVWEWRVLPGLEQMIDIIAS